MSSTDLCIILNFVVYVHTVTIFAGLFRLFFSFYLKVFNDAPISLYVRKMNYFTRIVGCCCDLTFLSDGMYVKQVSRKLVTSVFPHHLNFDGSRRGNVLNSFRTACPVVTVIHVALLKQL